MKITYGSNRIRVSQELDGTYSCEFKMKRFLLPSRWYVCGSGFATEKIAIGYASSAWFTDRYFPKNRKNRTRVTQIDNTYIAERRILKFFWINISGRKHQSFTDAQAEINSYENDFFANESFERLHAALNKRKVL